MFRNQNAYETNQDFMVLWLIRLIKSVFVALSSVTV